METPPAFRPRMAPTPQEQRKNGSPCGDQPLMQDRSRATPLSLGQLALQALAGGVARERVEELDLAGDLVAGEVGLDVALDVVLAQIGALVRDHESLQPLAEVLVVDLAGEHILPPGDDHLVVTAVDEEPALLVEVPHVAGRQEALEPLLAPATRVALERHLV